MKLQNLRYEGCILIENTRNSPPKEMTDDCPLYQEEEGYLEMTVKKNQIGYHKKKVMMQMLKDNRCQEMRQYGRWMVLIG